MDSIEAIKFAAVGLASLLKGEHLSVPPNQRDYSWEERNVDDLFTDISSAISDEKAVYFMGTVVLNIANPDLPQIVDGQQRIATTAIFFAALRDYYLEQGEERAADSIEKDYLLEYDVLEDEDRPRLLLNTDDNTFFCERILLRPDAEQRLAVKTPVRESHKKIDHAAEIASRHVRDIASRNRNKKAELQKWVKFMTMKAIVISIRSPDESNTYKMFETLNDRGLRTTLADILKNHLFEQAKPNLAGAQAKWSSMMSSIEGLRLRDGDERVKGTHLGGEFGPTW